jgi:DNA-binding SARP family transcriptional activator
VSFGSIACVREASLSRLLTLYYASGRDQDVVLVCRNLTSFATK